MAKPLSEDAILVAKALKNFDPEKYDYMNSECCLAGQHYGRGPIWGSDHGDDKWWKLSYMAAKLHGISPKGACDGHKIGFKDGKAIAKALKKRV